MTTAEYTTDLREVKTVAKSLLLMDISKTEYSPIVVQHPFTSSGFTILPGKHLPIDITANAENLKRWQDFVGSQIDRAKNAYEIYIQLNKPYGLTFLKYAKQYLSTEEMSALLADAWIRSENPNMDSNVTKRELVSMFEKADKTLIMTGEERKRLTEFGETVTVYRGVTPYNARNVKALSWTVDKKKAEWFAYRFGESGTVYKAQINKADILAFFTSRDESEIVLNPNKLKQICAI